MSFWLQSDAYGIHDEDDSSDVISTSSEDEIDIILKGTPEQKKKLKRLQNKQIADRLDERKRRNKSSSSEDEFEQEMNAELAQHVSFLEESRVPAGVSEGLAHTGASQQSSQGNQAQKESFYDNIYFDSDEEEDDDGSCHPESRKHAVISNDDLLYDPTMDDKDQMWVDRQRRKNNNTILEGLAPTNNRKPRKLPTSDALLDCPACLTTLCLDCQRHETYKHQYRAMFVMNCVVDSTEQLQCPEQQTKGKRKKKKTTMENDSGQNFIPDGITGSDLFHSIKCTECNTVVGVIDSDEVYHFFNVLSSHT